MKIIFISLFFILLWDCSSIFAQDSNEVVAEIGTEKITSRDFKIRFELSPFLPTDKNIDPDSIKFNFLYSLIAEKLWAKEADFLGMTNTESFYFYYEPLEAMFVRDALFKLEVEDKVFLSAQDINNGIIKSQAKLSTQIVTTNDSASIYNFYKQINSNNNIDSLLSISPNLTGKIFDITLGTLKDEEIEDSIYSLPINGFTSPIKSEVGWVIMIIRNKILTPIDLGNQQSIDNMKKIIRNRRIEKRYKEYLNILLGSTTIDINPESFKILYKQIWDILKTISAQSDNQNYYEISETDFNSIKILLANVDIEKELFSISDEKFTIENFLSSLAFKGFHVNLLDSVSVLQKLNKNVKQFIEEQLISEEGYKRGLQLTPQVRNDLSTWKENYSAQIFYNRTLDSINVTDSDTYNYYLDELVNTSNIILLNVRMVTLQNLDEVSKIFESLKQGLEFKDIVKTYGSTDSLVNNDGETGLKPSILLGYIGNVALDLDLNEVYGPIKRNNAYSILQVIERQNSSDSLKLSFDLIKNQLRNELKFKILNEKLIEITSKLAEKYNVKIFNEAINKIQSSNIPFFVHRLMGFGGRIAGVPLTTPFSGWINNEVKQKLLP